MVVMPLGASSLLLPRTPQCGAAPELAVVMPLGASSLLLPTPLGCRSPTPHYRARRNAPGGIQSTSTHTRGGQLRTSCICRNAPGGIQSTSTTVDPAIGKRIEAEEVVMPLGASSLLLLTRPPCHTSGPKVNVVMPLGASSLLLQGIGRRQGRQGQQVVMPLGASSLLLLQRHSRNSPGNSRSRNAPGGIQSTSTRNDH